MPIKSVCNSNVVTIQKSSTLHDASNLMQKYHVGSVVVTDSINGRKIPAGIITDRDIAMTLGATHNPSEIRVEQIMQAMPITVSENDGIYETIVKMRRSGVKRLPVINEEGSLCGIISSDDLLSLIGEEISNLGKINEIQVRNEQGIKIPVEKRI